GVVAVGVVAPGDEHHRAERGGPLAQEAGAAARPRLGPGRGRRRQEQQDRTQGGPEGLDLHSSVSSFEWFGKGSRGGTVVPVPLPPAGAPAGGETACRSGPSTHSRPAGSSSVRAAPGGGLWTWAVTSNGWPTATLFGSSKWNLPASGSATVTVWLRVAPVLDCTRSSWLPASRALTFQETCPAPPAVGTGWLGGPSTRSN